MCPAVRQQCFETSSLRARHANCSVVGCINQHQCLYSVPAREKQETQWLRFIFSDNVPAVVHVNLCVYVNHSNDGQYKAGFASTLTSVSHTLMRLWWPANLLHHSLNMECEKIFPPFQHIVSLFFFALL